MADFVELHLEGLRRAAGVDGDRGENMTLSTKDANDPKRPIKIKFIRNTAEDGVDYGPDYPKKVAEVPFHRVATYISGGRTVAAGDDDELKDIEDAARESGQLPKDKKSK
jgi:hypothetical protein